MERLPALTGMRGAAASAVLFSHAVAVWVLTGQPWPGGTPPSLVHYGWIGVDFFFVLSGFLLALPLLGTIEQVRERAFWRRYMARRWLRIAPPYYAALLLALLLAGQASYLLRNPWDAFLHLTYLHSFDESTIFSINGVFWTLGIEFQFYLLLPLLALVLSARRWWIPAAALTLMTLGWRAWTFVGLDHSGWLFYTLPSFILHFTVGVLAARFYRSSPRLPSAARAALPWASLALIAAALAILVPDGVFRQGETSLVSHLLLRNLLAIGFGGMILGTLLGAPLVSGFFTSRPMMALGEMSYSVYLAHLPILLLFAQWAPAHRLGLPAFVIMGIAASLVASFAFYGIIERPSLRLREAFHSFAKRVVAIRSASRPTTQPST